MKVNKYGILVVSAVMLKISCACAIDIEGMSSHTEVSNKAFKLVEQSRELNKEVSIGETPAQQEADKAKSDTTGVLLSETVASNTASTEPAPPTAPKAKRWYFF
ncbi:MAG: hypothetical protein K2Y18_04475 [Alphaproteobacteria bacterium]|jgi:hypothetical protein|nr:hypothetical protein [Alphaproteobacteria bacterium]